jgi:hypothetical protein
MKGFLAVLAIVIVLVLAMTLPAVGPAVKAFRTDVVSQSFTVATAGGETSANVSLSKPLWDASVIEITALSSNTTDDAPVASSYNGTGQLLQITGLAVDTSRTLSVSYRTGGLTDYAGADTGATKLPAIVVFLVILVPLAVVVAIFVKR